MNEEEKTKELTKEDMEILVGEDGLKRYYHKIKNILEEYMDMDKEYYSLVALWIVGTYLQKQFSAYPYLFFNAMKGSGKTRALKIIANLSKNGKLVGSMSESVLFRKARERTLCIDELESINAKGQENLRLLLNSAYKKGLSVERMRKNKDGTYDVEEFDVYCPIAMANIWGMENILSDRCISAILEKSAKNEVVKLIEIFETDIEFQTIKGGLKRITEKIKDDSNIFGNIFIKWNNYVKNVVNNVKDVKDVKDVNIVNNKGKIDDIDDIDDITTLFQDINSTNLTGRDLELFFPLFIIADMIDRETLNELLQTAKKIVKLRKETDREENRDAKVYEFIAQSDYEGYIDVARVVSELKEYYGEDEKWINSRGISRALSRLKLVLARRSSGKSRQVKLDILKAKEKLLMFKEPEEIQELIKNPDEELEELKQKVLVNYKQKESDSNE